MSKKRKMVVGSSWKIYFKSVTESKRYFDILEKNLGFLDPNIVEVYVLPDFISLGIISTLDINSKIKLGAQDMFWEDNGPYTGEVSPLMLKDIGCKYIYIGHSERKMYFGENDYTINKKVLACYRNGLAPLLLVGETMDEYKEEKTFNVLEKQLSIALDGIPPKFMEELVLVYEPRWAIGQRDAASLDTIANSHSMVRDCVKKIYDKNTAEKTRIIYGGSVNYHNARSIIGLPGVDGLGITRASLDPFNFSNIIKFVDIEARERIQN